LEQVNKNKEIINKPKESENIFNVPSLKNLSDLEKLNPINREELDA